MKTRKPLLVGMMTLLAMASLACGLLGNAVNKAVGGDQNFQKTESLWSDVPQMDGLKLSDLETMPAFIKVGLRFILGNLGRLNPAGGIKPPGTLIGSSSLPTKPRTTS